MKNLSQIPDIPEQEQTPLVKALLSLLEQQSTRVVLLEQTVAGLKDEINILKGEKKRPKFKPGGMDESCDDKSGGITKPSKRAGSKKESKNAKLDIHEDVIVSPSSPDSTGFTIQGLSRFRCAGFDHQHAQHTLSTPVLDNP